MKKLKPGDRVAAFSMNDFTVAKIEGDVIIGNGGERVNISHTKPATGSDELRLIVRCMGYTIEGFHDDYNSEQLIQIYRMHLASEWDISPDKWTTRQVREALKGIPPRWDDEGKPVYETRGP